MFIGTVLFLWAAVACGKWNCRPSSFLTSVNRVKASSTKLAPHACIGVCMENAEIFSCQQAPLDFVSLIFILWQAIGFVQLPKQFGLCLVHSLSNVKLFTESSFAHKFNKKKGAICRNVRWPQGGLKYSCHKYMHKSVVVFANWCDTSQTKCRVPRCVPC